MCANECVHLRGAPSAISMAVIPRDQISLCKTHRGAGQSLAFIWSHSLMLTQTNCCYPVVIGGVRVLITGNDLWCHPVRCTNEGVPTPHGPVQLSAHPKINWTKIRGRREVRRWQHIPASAIKWPKTLNIQAFNVPSLTSAFSVSSTFWPLMSLWMTLWAWRWERPCSMEQTRQNKKLSPKESKIGQ